MTGSAVRLLLGLLLTQQTVSQDASTQQPEASAERQSNSTEQRDASGEKQWTELGDDSIELHDFHGRRIPAVLLQEARYLRIVDSDIQSVPENTFAEMNVTNATLEIINTTIHQWEANSMEPFTSISFTASRIKQLNRNGIRFARETADPCDVSRVNEHTVRFNGSTIEDLHTHGISIQSRGSLLELTNSTVGAVQSTALHLTLGVQLRVENTIIGAVTPASFCNVCSIQVHFERNRILHAPPHSLHFGSQQCSPQGGAACRHLRRRVVITDNTLPCRPLGWLRDALNSCGSLAVNAYRDYTMFRDGSRCSDRPEPVRDYLAREPEPEPEPEPGSGWCQSEAAVAGTAVALAAGFLLVGLVVGCRCRGSCGGTALHLLQRTDSRHVHDRFAVGDVGVSLSMDRRDVKGAKDAGPHQDRTSPPRYETASARAASAARRRASTPEQNPPQQQLLPPLPENTGSRSPKQQKPRTGGPRSAQHRQRRARRGPAAAPADEPTYENQQRVRRGPAAAPADQPTYENQQRVRRGPAAAPADEPTYENQQRVRRGPAAEPADQPTYENQQRVRRGPAAAPADEPTYENQQRTHQAATQPAGDQLYENQQWSDQHAGQPSGQRKPEEQVYVNQQWPGEPAEETGGNLFYENLHRRY